MLFALTLSLLASNPLTMAGGRSAPLVPPVHVSALTSNPATECSGDDITTTQGGAISVTRALAAYCEKADGSLTLVATGKPRVNNRGILVEGQRTNLVPRSQDLDHADWVKSNAAVVANGTTDPAGGSTMDIITTTAAGGYVESKAFVPSQTTMTVSLWAFEGSGIADFDVVVRDTTAGVDRATCDFAPSDIEVSTRIICNASGLTGANNHVIRIYPGGTASAAGGDEVAIWGVQAEALLTNFATSYIPTAGVSVQRPNDVVTFANGTDISAAGCIAADITFLNPTISSTAGLVSNGTERMMGYTNATTMQMNDGTNTVSATVSSVLGRTIAMKTSWSGSTMTIVADGVTASGAFDGSFSSTATMRLGATAAASGYAYAYIDNVRIGVHPNSCD
jgi:hypothetical protein